MLEVEVHTDQATNENQDVHGPGGETEGWRVNLLR